MARDGDKIEDQNWAIFDPGSTVITADGEEFGSVRETMPHYLTLRVRKNLLEEVEIYIPREMVARVEEERIVLTHTADQLGAMELTKPPAIRADTAT